MDKKFPWFKFYPNEYMIGDIMYCSNETQGIFVRIMCICWQKGELPKEPSRLAKLINAKEDDTERAMEELQQHRIIQDADNGMFAIRFMAEQVTEAIGKHEAQSEGGKKGMRSKYKGK